MLTSSFCGVFNNLTHFRRLHGDCWDHNMKVVFKVGSSTHTHSSSSSMPQLRQLGAPTTTTSVPAYYFVNSGKLPLSQLPTGGGEKTGQLDNKGREINSDDQLTLQYTGSSGSGHQESLVNQRHVVLEAVIRSNSAAARWQGCSSALLLLIIIVRYFSAEATLEHF